MLTFGVFAGKKNPKWKKGCTIMTNSKHIQAVCWAECTPKVSFRGTRTTIGLYFGHVFWKVKTKTVFSQNNLYVFFLLLLALVYTDLNYAQMICQWWYKDLLRITWTHFKSAQTKAENSNNKQEFLWDELFLFESFQSPELDLNFGDTIITQSTGLDFHVGQQSLAWMLFSVALMEGIWFEHCTFSKSADHAYNSKFW